MTSNVNLNASSISNPAAAALNTSTALAAKDLDISRTYSQFSKNTLSVSNKQQLISSDCDKLNIYNTLSKDGSTTDSKMTDSKSNSSNIYAGGTQTSLSLNKSLNEKAAKDASSNLADSSKSSTGVSSHSTSIKTPIEKSSSIAINNLNISVSASGTSSGQPITTTATSLSTTGTAGGDSIMPQQSRKKVSLGKGYSLMDWIRVTKENPNIAGNYGIMRKITPEELALHNKEDDCWLALFGKVYNVTPYMKFHPGGIDELMRGAGINSTDLFNEVILLFF